MTKPTTTTVAAAKNKKSGAKKPAEKEKAVAVVRRKQPGEQGLSRARMMRILRASAGGKMRVSVPALSTFIGGIEDSLVGILLAANKIAANSIDKKKNRRLIQQAKKSGTTAALPRRRIGAATISRAISSVGGRAFEACVVVQGAVRKTL